MAGGMPGWSGFFRRLGETRRLGAGRPAIFADRTRDSGIKPTAPRILALLLVISSGLISKRPIGRYSLRRRDGSSKESLDLDAVQFPLRLDKGPRVFADGLAIIVYSG